MPTTPEGGVAGLFGEGDSSCRLERWEVAVPAASRRGGRGGDPRSGPQGQVRGTFGAGCPGIRG